MSQEKQTTKSERTEPTQGRPYMSADYGVEQSKTDSAKMLSWQWLCEQMERSHNYWISTTQPDGKPHAMPVWGIWLDEIFYFSTGRQSRKGRNLAANPEVVVHTESGDEVAIFEGTVEEFSDPTLFARFAQVYATKYAGFKPEAEPGNAYYKLNPRVAFAWLEKDFVNSATRWQF